MFQSPAQARSQDRLGNAHTRRPQALDLATVSASIAAGLLVLWQLGLRDRTFTDWVFEARAPVVALLNGQIHRFLSQAPVYGASLILRAPFMLAARGLLGGDRATYIASVLPCVAALAALAVWLSRRLRAAGASCAVQAIVILLCLANPLAVPALRFGHPEDLLGSVLCLAALLSAQRDRPALAGALLGLAIANKEWAVLAFGPVLLALPRGRIVATILAGAVGGALVAPFLLDGSSGVVAQGTAVGLGTGALFKPWQIWWFLGAQRPHSHGWRVAPAWVAGIGHLLVMAVMPPLCAFHLWWRRRQTGQPYDLVLLLALLLALRCLLDPWDISYYSLPVLLALLTWEVLTFPRIPVLTLCATLTAWLIYGQFTPGIIQPNAQALRFLLVCVPAVAAMAVALYRPGRAEGVRGSVLARALRSTWVTAALDRQTGPHTGGGEATTAMESVQTALQARRNG